MTLHFRNFFFNENAAAYYLTMSPKKSDRSLMELWNKSCTNN